MIDNSCEMPKLFELYLLVGKFFKWDESKNKMADHFLLQGDTFYILYFHQFLDFTLLFGFSFERPGCPQYPFLISRRLEFNFFHVFTSSLTICVVSIGDLDHIHPSISRVHEPNWLLALN